MSLAEKSIASSDAPDASQRRSEERAARVGAELLLLEEAGRAVDVVAGAGVAAVVVKGAAFASLVYAPGERKMTDVDLLVPRRELRRARAALVGAGFRSISERGRPFGARLHRAVTVVGRGGVVVDVHADIAQRVRWPVDVDGVVARGEPMLLGRHQARRACVEDLIVIAALNDAKDDHVQRGAGVSDVVRASRQLAVRWDDVVARARAWRATVAAWLTLQLARERGAAVPDDVIARLRPRRARLVRPVLAALPTTPSTRRLRQALAGPLLTDSVPRFIASAGAFAVVRAADAVASRFVSGEPST